LQLIGDARRLLTLPLIMRRLARAGASQADDLVSRGDLVRAAREVMQRAGGAGAKRISRVALHDRPRFLRLYGPARFPCALRHWWASQAGTAAGLAVPMVQRGGFVRTGLRVALALIEDVVPGQPLRGWTQPLAACFGRDLATWHRLHDTSGPTGPVMRLLPVLGSGHYAKRLAVGAEASFTAEQLRMIRAAAGWLEDASFVGPVGVSHGDLHRGNLLHMAGDRIGWIDLDGACLRPTRHDLTVAQLHLLGRSGAEMDHFEASYFDGHAAARRDWLVHRRRWFAFSSVLQAVKWATVTHHLPGRRGRPEHDRRKKSQSHFQLAEVALSVGDDGQPTSRLVQDIRDARIALIRRRRGAARLSGG
jgi:Ser/Thr protein kinase RdoA (MazF antagonist)